jgi:putative FmdB family regulatory protein
MPSYEFKCNTCEQSVTVTTSMSELKTPHCGKCQKDMTRIYSFQNVKFKGSGFYSTDKLEDSDV